VGGHSSAAVLPTPVGVARRREAGTRRSSFSQPRVDIQLTYLASFQFCLQLCSVATRSLSSVELKYDFSNIYVVYSRHPLRRHDCATPQRAVRAEDGASKGREQAIIGCALLAT
jgi:hypothetical protein